MDIVQLISGSETSTPSLLYKGILTEWPSALAQQICMMTNEQQKLPEEKGYLHSSAGTMVYAVS